MKLKRLSWPAAFMMMAGVLMSGLRAEADPGKPVSVQIALGKLLNVRVIITQEAGRLQLADHGLDRGDSSILITKSAAEVSAAGKLNPLPDSGFFAADENHPDVQLPYGTAGGGPQVHQSSEKTETYSIPVPLNRYGQMQMFFISAAGPTPISVRLQYADGSSDLRTSQVPDFFFLPDAADKRWFVLAGDFGKVNQRGKMTESVHHYIHGFNLDPDPTKMLQQIEISKENSKSVLNLFGVTGKLSD
jgi:hypothetical protein